MKRFILLILLGLATNSSVTYAQSDDLTFQSSELQQMALRYTGNTLNWPLLISIADHDIPNNTFTLSSSDFIQLQALATTTAKVMEQQNRVKKLITSGATIFAKKPLERVNTLLVDYVVRIQEGQLEEVLNIGSKIEPAVDEMDSTLMANRLVQVQAQLAKKVGTVDKRLGLLGDWNDAFVGDLFKEADGVRTLEESFANLAFTDGSYVMVDPNTVAVIRKSRIDKLSQSSDTEISLVSGGLLAKLSAAAKEKSNYILNAGASTSELKTQNFYAESDGNTTVKLTNYDGIANISANDVTITIKKNEGTIVEEGRAPSAPIKLLEAPDLVWESRDTIIYRQDIVYAFGDVDRAVSYRAQISSSPSFDADIEELSLTSNSVNLDDLALGTTYVRVLAIDSLGLRGPFSEPTRIIRNIDNQPPPVFVDGSNGNILFTLNTDYQITGVSEPDTRLTINAKSVTVQLSGKFSHVLKDIDTDQDLEIVAVDASGNKTSKSIRLVKLTDDVLFKFNLTGASGSDPIKLNSPTVTLASKAYPELEVVVLNAGTERKIFTDSKGRWGITTNLKPGSLEVSFKNARTGITYITKSFTVEENQRNHD